MAQNLTPKGILNNVRGPLAAGTIGSTPMKARIDIQQMMKAKLAERIKSAAD